MSRTEAASIIRRLTIGVMPECVTKFEDALRRAPLPILIAQVEYLERLHEQNHPKD